MSFTIRLLMTYLIVAVALQAATFEQRIEALLARMTLEEKIGQMSQSVSLGTPISDQIKEEIRNGRWGSFLNAGSPADRAEAQRIVLKESRLGIPLLFGRDVIHGYRTIVNRWPIRIPSRSAPNITPAMAPPRVEETTTALGFPRFCCAKCTRGHSTPPGGPEWPLS